MQTVSGRKVILLCAAIALLVSLGFVAAVTLNYPSVRNALNRGATRPVEFRHPRGLMVLVEPPGAPPFYIDSGPVTYASFARFASSTGRPLPRRPSPPQPVEPATGVDPEAARLYCAWAQKRLPTEAEMAAAQDHARAPVHFLPGLAELKPGPVTGFRCALDATAR